MRGVAKIIILLIIGLSCVYAQNTTAPPTLQGRWDDTVCNLITNSAQYYQRRSYLFGAYSTTNGYGNHQHPLNTSTTSNTKKQ